MSAQATPGAAPAALVTPGSTANGARTVRKAIGRLERLASIGFVVSMLATIEAYLAWSGVFGKIPRPGEPFDLAWNVSLQIGIGVALAVIIAVLVIIAVITAILGLVVWRRGVAAMVEAAPEYGTAHTDAVRRARQHQRTTLWLFLAMILAAMIVGIAFAGVNGSLSLLGVGALPGVVGSVAVGVATGLVLVAIYYFGALHLKELLGGIATPTEDGLLDRGRSRMVLGALVGVASAFGAAFWGFDLFGVISIGIILTGVTDLARAYDLWIGEHAPAPIYDRLSGAVPA